jgi:hypothetical protein
MFGRSRALVARTLRETVAVFERLGFREVGERGAAEALLERDGFRIRLGIRGRGRVFGGTYALEAATADAVLPATRGLAGRGRGAVRLSGVAFSTRGRNDTEGARLAGLLAADRALQEALARVHFERVWVEPDGRPVVRHMGGSVVWMAFPPLVRAVPLVPEQAEALAAALAAFAEAGR